MFSQRDRLGTQHPHKPNESTCSREKTIQQRRFCPFLLPFIPSSFLYGPTPAEGTSPVASPRDCSMISSRCGKDASNGFGPLTSCCGCCCGGKGEEGGEEEEGSASPVMGLRGRGGGGGGGAWVVPLPGHSKAPTRPLRVVPRTDGEQADTPTARNGSTKRTSKRRIWALWSLCWGG